MINIKNILAVLLTIVVIVFVVITFNKNEALPQDTNNQNMNTHEQEFLNKGLATNTSIKSIELDQVISGGPGKDGIPSINDPSFISVAEAENIEDGDRLGISVSIGNTAKFYPYSILVWHEIVNDTIEDTPVLVTFCPLCGSAIVFDPVIAGVHRQFGVSGLLWESNLLMYDDVNENLWSQSVGKAVVGDDTGTILEIISSQLISFDEFKSKNPNGQVLSRDTGHNRNYGYYPYGDYDNNESMYFPISVQDNRLPGKEIMYVVNFNEKSVSFKRSDLVSVGSVNMDIDGSTISARVDNNEITVTDSTGLVIPGYHEMWFSWAIHHQEDGVVWTK